MKAFLAAIDNPLLVFIYSVIALAVVAHMNRMYKGTPKGEIFGWWLLGIGSFGVALYDIHGSTGEWAHIMVGAGVLILVVIHTQPDWRPVVANRRCESKDMEKVCDRRRNRKNRPMECDDETHSHA